MTPPEREISAQEWRIRWEIRAAAAQVSGMVFLSVAWLVPSGTQALVVLGIAVGWFIVGDRRRPTLPSVCPGVLPSVPPWIAVWREYRSQPVGWTVLGVLLVASPALLAVALVLGGWGWWVAFGVVTAAFIAVTWGGRARWRREQSSGVSTDA